MCRHWAEEVRLKSKISPYSLLLHHKATSTSGNAMIGCVTLVTVQVGGVMPPYEVIAVASNEVDECTDGNECSQRDCNKVSQSACLLSAREERCRR